MNQSELLEYLNNQGKLLNLCISSLQECLKEIRCIENSTTRAGIDLFEKFKLIHEKLQEFEDNLGNFNLQRLNSLPLPFFESLRFHLIGEREDELNQEVKSVKILITEIAKQISDAHDFQVVFMLLASVYGTICLKFNDVVIGNRDLRISKEEAGISRIYRILERNKKRRM